MKKQYMNPMMTVICIDAVIDTMTASETGSGSGSNGGMDIDLGKLGG